MSDATGTTTPHPTLVSVIVPVFNYARFIGEALASLVAQQYPAWECIVVDDGSTDDTAAVVAQWCARDPRIRYVGQPNRGQAAARNVGLRRSQGQYVQLLDADDLIEPNKLGAHARFLEHHRDVDIVYGDARFFPTNAPHHRRKSLDEPDHDWMPRISGRGGEVANELLERNIMVINAPLVRRRTFDDVGPFDEALPRADDWDMWLRCALAGKRFEYRDEVGTLALVRAHSTSLTQRDRRLLASSVKIHRKVPELTSDAPLRERSALILSWLERVLRASRQIDESIPADRAFILVDDDKLRPELRGYRAIPFTERAGQYDGPPATAAHAIEELHRLRRQRDAGFIVFAWPAMWYLDHYPPFRDYLNTEFPRIVNTEDVTIYHLAN